MYLSAILAVALSGHSNEAPETVFEINEEQFSCTPRVTKQGARLFLEKRHPAFDELAVLTPHGQVMHFLIVGDPPKEMTPLMTTAEYSKTKKLEIDVTSLRGLEWKEGSHPERIFTVPGRYEFFLSENLESEQGGYRCIVEFAE